MNIEELISNKEKLDEYYTNYQNRKLIIKSLDTINLKNAHIKKAEHNLEHVDLLLQTSKFNDWILISLYYSLYHTFLALVQNKCYSSKNHNATIVFILKHYVQIEINELKLLDKLYVSEEDAKFYMNLKETREKANYSTELNFENSNIVELIEKVKEIHLKVKEILE